MTGTSWFARVFTAGVIDRLTAVEHPTEELTRRLETIRLGQAGFSPAHSLIDPQWAHKRRRAWESYLDAAGAIGLFDGQEGPDLLARLRSIDVDQFRSGIAECLAAWFLRDRLGFEVAPRPCGRAGKLLDLSFSVGGVGAKVEVKAPHRDRPTEPWWGDDSDLLRSALESANKQFGDDVANLLFLAPELRAPLFEDGEQLIHAFFGHSTFVWGLRSDTGDVVEPGETRFHRSGHFLNPLLPNGKPFKHNAEPRFTRVSAVMAVERTIGEESVEHWPMLARNPFAAKPLPEEIWGDMPQLVVRGPEMKWINEREEG